MDKIIESSGIDWLIPALGLAANYLINDLYHIGRLVDDECFGTLVFLTREEAEAALAERRKASVE